MITASAAGASPGIARRLDRERLRQGADHSATGVRAPAQRHGARTAPGARLPGQRAAGQLLHQAHF